MSLHFSEEGTELPDQLVNSLLAGEVVFLCGAGVSAPYLPTFSKLVDQCFERLGFEKNDSETVSYVAGRYEEVLGSLSRRTVDPKDVQNEVVKILHEHSKEAKLSHHDIILKLSRNLENRHVVVTTNFDTLFEKALAEKGDGDLAKEISFSGQDLPIPGSTSFDGIIHIHGRMADEKIGLDQTPMILTSADYGDAYMRSGWASRFLFDLCRCKTVVLLGYSAGDAPVRYFLNVLEADRQRFSDVLPVYAFDTVDDLSKPDNRWGALAVKPILFESPNIPGTKSRDYSALWNQLESLSELVMKPRATRTNWVSTILQGPFEFASLKNKDNIIWLLKNKRDLFPIVKKSVTDVAWMEFFISKEMWSTDDTSWFAAQWLSKDFESVANFSHAIKWHKIFGETFKQQVCNLIDSKEQLSGLWRKAWYLLISSKGKNTENNFYPYITLNRLKREPIKKIIYESIDIITPQYTLSMREIGKSWEFNRIADLVSSTWSVGNLHSASEFADALLETPDPILVMSATSAKLLEILQTSSDLDSISEDFDRNDFGVPSIEPHAQNEHHDGVLFLVQTLSRVLDAAIYFDLEGAKKICATWYEFPGYLGKRLWLHSLRNDKLNSDDDALSGLQELPIHAFWHIRREIALVLQERSAHANPTLVKSIEQRIIYEGKSYYDKYEIISNKFDWRQYALDKEIWLRLSMLKNAGSITSDGQKKLSVILDERSDLIREVIDQDFFGTYHYPVETVVGNASKIIEADDDEKLEVARRIIQSPDIRDHLGWSTFCRTEPEKATDMLLSANLEIRNAPLWNSLLSYIKWPSNDNEVALIKKLELVFIKLINAPESFLRLISAQFVNLYVTFPVQHNKNMESSWLRLIEISSNLDTVELEFSNDIFEEARYSTCGQLTALLLQYVQHNLSKRKKATKGLQELIKKSFHLPGRQGVFARVVLVQNAGFIVKCCDKSVLLLFKEAFKEEKADSILLRSVLVHKTPISSLVSRSFTKQILQGIQETTGSGQKSKHAANILILAAISKIRADGSNWNLSLDQISISLRKASDSVREGALIIILGIFNQLDKNPGEVWRLYISPIISRWPRDKTLYNTELSKLFCRIAILTGSSFPDALKMITPFISGHQGNYLSDDLIRTELPEMYPTHVLDMLWRVNGRGDYGFLWGINKVLDRLILAKPGIEEDRRFQWLDQAAIQL
jgi:hypothetical protein